MKSKESMDKPKVWNIKLFGKSGVEFLQTTSAEWEDEEIINFCADNDAAVVMLFVENRGVSLTPSVSKFSKEF
eukprot:CAMPEP_0185691436 /NCGR_PEP_ID=MMETSP1164-20130828/1831_1 /TAXON_ID=1104430 /ORGANISM="Chrysoreinhardia sp, Strain CCMP2950" /LENGTH=72 /DNA_ID=CAMNT_0028358097 /DNA_START=301 /DNA_END=519 /DNA_ORIENTATION=-